MKNKRWENADYLKTRSVNYEALKLATKIRDQAFEIKFHHGKPSLPAQFKKLRNLVDKMENLLNKTRVSVHLKLKEVQNGKD